MDQIFKIRIYKIREIKKIIYYNKILKKTNKFLLIIVIKIRKTLKIQIVIGQMFKIKIYKIRKIYKIINNSKIIKKTNNILLIIVI